MKYLFVAFLGWLVGAALAGALLYFNPLTTERNVLPATADRALRYRLPEDALDAVRGEGLVLPLVEAAGETVFWEEAIRNTALLGVVLRDAATGAPVAVASRVAAPSANTDLLLRGLLLDDHWLVTFPGEGSLYVRAESNLWPFLKESLIPVRYLGRPWSGSADYRPIVGPEPSSSALLIGATGVFAGRDGTATEHYRLTSLDALAGAVDLDLQLTTALAAAEQPPASP